MIDSVDGKADRQNDKVVVALTKPIDKKFDLEAAIVFPTEHVRRIIAAAREDKSIIELPVYDGSEKGQKVYETTAIIGKQIAPGADQNLEAVAKEKGLAELVSWPVSIGYFEPKTGDLTPSYQIDFRLYANGVSRELLIDYGDVSIHGTLTSLEYLKAEACH